MSAPAVFEGSYADLKFVRSRGVCQVVIELPLENSAAFVAAFGAPNPASETPVALARLTEHAAPQEPPKSLPAPEKRKWKDMPTSQQAAIRCNEPDFWRFLNEIRRDLTFAIDCSDDAAAVVREICGVESRSALNHSAAAASNWARLDDDFFKWQRGAR